MLEGGGGVVAVEEEEGGKGREGARARETGPHVRNEHEHLFICIANKFWLCVHSLRPSLFDNLGSRIELEFIQGADLFEFDLLPDERLEGRFEIVGVVVSIVVAVVAMIMMMVVMTVVVEMVVVMRHFVVMVFDH